MKKGLLKNVCFSNKGVGLRRGQGSEKINILKARAQKALNTKIKKMKGK